MAQEKNRGQARNAGQLPVFFQAEDGIRDLTVTGVQTCALPIFVDWLNSTEEPSTRVHGTAVFLNANRETTPLALRYNVEHNRVLHEHVVIFTIETASVQIGRASCRERGKRESEGDRVKKKDRRT